MSTNQKPVKTSRLGDAVAGQPAEPAPETKAKTQAKTKPSSPKASSSKAVETIQAAAKAQAKSDAAAIIRHGEQVYAHTLEAELRSLMGGAEQDYFRAPVESWTLPDTAHPQQLASVTVDALPSAN